MGTSFLLFKFDLELFCISKLQMRDIVIQTGQGKAIYKPCRSMNHLFLCHDKITGSEKSGKHLWVSTYYLKLYSREMRVPRVCLRYMTLLSHLQSIWSCFPSTNWVYPWIWMLNLDLHLASISSLIFEQWTWLIEFLERYCEDIPFKRKRVIEKRFEQSVKLNLDLD